MAEDSHLGCTALKRGLNPLEHHVWACCKMWLSCSCWQAFTDFLCQTRSIEIKVNAMNPQFWGSSRDDQIFLESAKIPADLSSWLINESLSAQHSSWALVSSAHQFLKVHTNRKSLWLFWYIPMIRKAQSWFDLLIAAKFEARLKFVRSFGAAMRSNTYFTCCFKMYA